MATGYHNAGLPKLCAKLKELNIRGVSVSMAGYGFTSWRSDFRLCDYAADVEAVLKAEGITGPLMVEGASYGAGLAAAVAHRFAERCTHLHVRAAQYVHKRRRGAPRHHFRPDGPARE